MTFPIRSIDQSRATQYEPVGSKPKVWLDGDDYLFKGEVRGTGADWAEVVASQLCRLLGLPHVEYDLAVFVAGEKVLQRGVICPNMAPGDKELVLGNQLLLDIDKTYPSKQRWKVRQHTVEAVCHALEVPSRPASKWTADSPEWVFDATGFFIGYVMLDAWIANQDRHHENWGLIWDPTVAELQLAPTFDHGAGMACILTDEKRHRHLTTRDRHGRGLLRPRKKRVLRQRRQQQHPDCPRGISAIRSQSTRAGQAVARSAAGCHNRYGLEYPPRGSG
jgi:hypothetical protein